MEINKPGESRMHVWQASCEAQSSINIAMGQGRLAREVPLKLKTRQKGRDIDMMVTLSSGHQDLSRTTRHSVAAEEVLCAASDNNGKHEIMRKMKRDKYNRRCVIKEKTRLKLNR